MTRSDLAEVAAEAIARIDGRPVVVSISGGKDSTATALWLRELGIQATYLHMDTGWEHPDTDAYVRDYLPRVLGQPIHIVGRPGGMAELVRHKGTFPSRVRRFCTQELKIKPARTFLEAAGDDVVNAVGIRAEESAARASAVEWEDAEWFGGETWRPILRWSFQDVVDIHTRHGVTPNPLYLRGAERVGCFPCIHARKDEVRRMADLDPWAIDRLRVLEAEVGVSARERAEARGDDLAAWNPPAWFQARLPDHDGGYPAWPIDKVVEWSRTSRGGRQFELFDAPASDAGCVRWGLCDTGAKK
jgi:3'-phosphoadenosine 5'-phosphosulfate sulfotransferase (PAPS reductase)/FAD synthetase